MLHVNSIEKKFAKNTDVLYKVYFVPVIDKHCVATEDN